MQLNPRLYPEARHRQEEVFAVPAGCDQAHQNGCAPHQEGYENPAEIGSPGELWGKAAVGSWHLAFGQSDPAAKCWKPTADC